MEKISVIIPVYGVEKYLDKCIESVVAQSHKNLEIILVDDASVDNSGKICDEWVDKDHRIKVVHNDSNVGLGLTRNRGLKETTGDFVVFIDSDDWLGKEHIENLYKKIKQENAQICMGGFTRVFNNGTKQSQKNKLTKSIYKGDDIISGVLLDFIAPDVSSLSDMQIQPSSCLNMYSLSMIKNNEITFVSERDVVGEDFFFNIRCLYAAKTVVVSESTEYYYYENNESISGKYRPERFDRTINFYREMNKITEELNIKDRVGYRIERNFIARVRGAIKLISVSDLAYSEKVLHIKRFLKTSETKNALKIYPIATYSKKLKLVALMMKYECIFPLYVLMTFRTKIKNIGT